MPTWCDSLPVIWDVSRSIFKAAGGNFRKRLENGRCQCFAYKPTVHCLHCQAFELFFGWGILCPFFSSIFWPDSSTLWPLANSPFLRVTFSPKCLNQCHPHKVGHWAVCCMTSGNCYCACSSVEKLGPGPGLSDEATGQWNIYRGVGQGEKGWFLRSLGTSMLYLWNEESMEGYSKARVYLT